jgi:hypothetical protein
MKIDDQQVQGSCLTACIDIVSDAATALRAKRLTHRLARLAEITVLSAEEAVLGDLNHLVFAAVEDALPLCLLQGTRLALHQDPRVPAVPILPEPIEDALAATLDLCLETHAELLRVQTGVRGSWAVASFERLVVPPSTDSAPWIDLDDTWPIGRVELLVGSRTTRALGGRMRFQRRSEDLRICLELPITESLGWSHEQGTKKPKRDAFHPMRLELPGAGYGPNLTTRREIS